MEWLSFYPEKPNYYYSYSCFVLFCFTANFVFIEITACIFILTQQIQCLHALSDECPSMYILTPSWVSETRIRCLQKQTWPGYSKNRVITEIVHMKVPIVTVVPGSTMMHYLYWNSCSEMQVVRLQRESVKIHRNWNNVMTWKDCINSTLVSKVRCDWRGPHLRFPTVKTYLAERSWSKCITYMSMIHLLILTKM